MSSPRPSKAEYLDVADIIQEFGGVTVLSEKLEIVGTPITIGGIEKWRERSNIPGQFIVRLAQIAEQEGWDFKLTNFISEA